MDVKKIILIVVALVVAIGAAFGVNQMMRGSAAPTANAAAAPAVDGPKVMVATRALPVGTILTADALRFQAWPEGLVKPDQYYVEGSADISGLVGSVVRNPITSGAPVTKGALVNPGDRGFLAAALGPGMRAVTVPLSPDQGVGGFVFPGDRVDLLLTLTLENEDDSKIKLYTTETVVRNLRVLAVDQRTTPTDENGNTTPLPYATVTVEATPQIAERIAVARTTGTVSLALRSIADTAGELEEAIASGAVSVGRDGDRRAEARLLGGNSGRPEAGSAGATTGGDVSRYLRRGMPPRSFTQQMAGGGAAPGAGSAGPQAQPIPVPVGPSVRVVRGDQVTVVPVGAIEMTSIETKAVATRASLRSRMLLGAMAIGLSLAATGSLPQTAEAQTRAQGTTAADLLLSVGRGRLISLPAPMTDVFVANQEVADVQVRSSTQLYVFGKAPGETSVYATDRSGRVVYSVVARVGNNIETIDQMLTLAMPDARINVNTMNGFVLLTGTVAAPEDAAEADRLVTAFVGEGTRVLSRLQTATPLQVNLQVRIAEVNKSVIRQIGGNLLSRDGDGNGIIFGAFRGRNSGSITPVTPVRGIDPLYNATQEVDLDPRTGCAIARCGERVNYAINALTDAATLGLGGRLFGLDLLGTLDLAERSGLVATLAQPNLTTISGETADFLAGGEYPIPVPDPLTGSITIQYRKFGVSLAYTPTVLSNGRISMRVRPEVSELSSEGAIRLQGIDIPALSIRRAETTVELGSGESFMIAGLMSNRTVGTIDRTPGLGDVPILGTLFKSDNFRRGDTELVIVITPYLVRPVSADQIVLPTDGYQNPTDVQRFLLNGIADGTTGQGRPMPTLEQGDPATAPGMGSTNAGAALPAPTSQANGRSSRNRNDGDSIAPGFSSGN